MERISTRLAGFMLLLLVSSIASAQPNTISNDRINIKGFRVYAKESKLCFDWSTDGKVQTNVFEVQESSDGIGFTTVALVLGPDPKQKGDGYSCSFRPKNKINAHAVYRLKHIDTGGNEQLGEITHPSGIGTTTCLSTN